MTDLPRYHKGGLGPLDFQTINEAFRRLDALRPLLEQAGVNAKFRNIREETTIVFATKKEEAPPGEEPLALGDQSSASLYEWKEILVRDNDTIVKAEDDDADELYESASYRKGPNEEGYGLAICVDEEFTSGFCLLYPWNRMDGNVCHVLVPIETQTSSGFIAIVNAVASGEISVVNCSGEEDPDNPGESQSLQVNSLSCTRLRFKTAASVCLESSEITVFDFSMLADNKPDNLPPNTELEPIDIKPGSYIMVLTQTADDGSEVYVRSGFPRFDVECTAGVTEENQGSFVSFARMPLTRMEELND